MRRPESSPEIFMRIICPLSILSAVMLLGIITVTNCHASVSIVDSFDQGGFTISIPGNFNPVEESVALPLAQRRLTAFKVVFSPPNTAYESTLDSAAGTLAFVVSGPPLFPHIPITLELVYSGGGPYNISSCTNFILGFSELSGVGSLYIEAGTSEGLDVHRIDLTAPGDVLYSVSDVTANSIHSVDSFNILRFIFEARSDNFSFTLDEIRLVPEPGAGMLLLTAGIGFLSLRPRRRMAERD
jgi:hypothetical protein